ncbi:choice-of-anchor L domain-containing protein [Nannocystaceae bacterium ST9]
MKLDTTIVLTLALGVSIFGCADDQADGNEEVGNTEDSTATTGDGDTNTETGTSNTDATATDTGTDVTTTDADTTDATATDTDTTDATATDTGTSTDTGTDTGTDTSTDTGTTTDTTDTNTTGNANCEAPPSYVSCDGTPGQLTNDPWKAIGVNCPGADTETVQAANATMNSVNANAWRVAAQFGSANGNNPNYNGNPNFNGKLWAANDGDWTNPDDEVIPSNTSSAILILSTGVVSAANGQSVVLENNSQEGNGDNGNNDGDQLPPPLSVQKGSNNGMGGTPFVNCDGVDDCSDSLYEWWIVQGYDDPNDKLWMQADLTVPPGTEGFVFDFAYFSSEWPDWVDTGFNDQFIAWSTSEAYTGNLTFVNGAPLTITSLDGAGAFAFTNNAPELAQTGFTGNAGTGWFVSRGAAVPDEQFQLTFFISDLGDSILATGVLIDNFRWECAGCIPSEVNSCGIQPQ